MIRWLTGLLNPWDEFEGTSLSCPMWAGLIAIANQGLASVGLGSLYGSSETLPALYDLPASDFNDITTGYNGFYSAGPGYDLVTGIGTPKASLLIPDLVNLASTPTGLCFVQEPTNITAGSTFSPSVTVDITN